MATWNDLPNEIRHQILTFYCVDIVNTYEYPPFSKVPHVVKTPRFCNNWANPPKILKSFASAVRTCRSFYDTIIHVVKVDGVSPFDKLQSVQKRNIEVLLQWPQLWEIEIYTRLVGIFWRNPLVLSDAELMARIILNLPYESWPLLLPHLGDWVSANSCAGRICEISFLRLDCVANRGGGINGLSFNWDLMWCH